MSGSGDWKYGNLHYYQWNRLINYHSPFSLMSVAFQAFVTFQDINISASFYCRLCSRRPSLVGLYQCNGCKRHCFFHPLASLICLISQALTLVSIGASHILTQWALTFSRLVRMSTTASQLKPLAANRWLVLNYRPIEDNHTKWHFRKCLGIKAARRCRDAYTHKHA